MRLKTTNQITWNNGFRQNLVEGASAEDYIDDGDTHHFFRAELGENGYVISHGLHHGMLLDDDLSDAESNAEYHRIAGGNGEDREWVLNTAPDIIEAWIADGMPPIYDPDSDTPNAGDPWYGVGVIARIAHEANVAYCNVNPDPAVPTPPAWGDCTDAHRQGMVNGVEFVLANPYSGDRASHDNWLRAKQADGWKYGEVKDETAKTHPCYAPFADLSQKQQLKDALFRGVVLAFRVKAVVYKSHKPSEGMAKKALEQLQE